ncbi:hypothetical protein [Actinomycetospora sp. CA-084318]|uniref:hypothetical protein n=1 Tax=Actinomycetospora sp. CA-084318 TaxID=3239892 RepID=UPI003D96A696
MTHLSRTTTQPFRGTVAVRLGALTPDRLRGPEFIRLYPDTYVGADADLTDIRLRVQALHFWSRGHGIVAGPLAALAHGADCPWDDREVILGRRCRNPPDGVRVRVDAVPPEERVITLGAHVTSPVRTAFDLARRSPLVEAVAAVDALAFRRKFTADDLRALAEAHPGARGLTQVREVLELMNPLAQSLPETRLRLGLLARGVPPAVCQHPVRLLTGRFVHPDLSWPHAKLALEYDGPSHRDITGQNRDAFRDGDLFDVGWTVVRVTSAMVHDPTAFDRLAVRVMRRLAA